MDTSLTEPVKLRAIENVSGIMNYRAMRNVLKFSVRVQMYGMSIVQK
jgi:hypothetical protein